MRTRRHPRCLRCRQPEPVCICDLLVPIEVRTKLLVLMHHLEVRKTTNTGRLAALSLGARFELWGQADRGAPALPEGRVLLLFPADGARLLTPADADATLVIPDGSWPQARKIARRVETACAGRVERVRVEADGPSGYTLRHTVREGALSTFEAIVHALRILEGERGADISARSLALFHAFVARQTVHGQRAKYQRTRYQRPK